MELRTREADPRSPGSYTRREAIRRAALLGGTMVWAAPTLQQVGMRAAAAVSPPPPPPPPPSNFYGISFVAFVFKCGSTYHKAKYDAETGAWEDVESKNNDKGLANCAQIDRWTDAIPLPSPYNAPPGKSAIGADPVVVDGEAYEVTFTLPSGCTFEDGSAVVKGGAAGGDDDGCSYPQVHDSQTFTFTARAKSS